MQVQRTTRGLSRCVWLLALITLAVRSPHAHAQTAPSPEYPPELTDTQVDEVRAAIETFKADARGPYFRIRWFCRDGTVQPPQGPGCRERGGGNQHAQYNETRDRLASLGVHVGTVLIATPPETLIDRGHANDRLKQLVLEQFLVEIDDGWVLRQARFYRGARQAEDEEAAGTVLLTRLLADTAWVRSHTWLAHRLVADVPHTGAGGEQVVHRVRNLATEAADLEPAFLPARVKIHSFPSREDLTAVDRFLERPGLSPRARAKLTELRDALREQYDAAARARRLEQLARAAGLTDFVPRLAEVRRDESADVEAALAAVSELALETRGAMLASTNGARNLRLADLGGALAEYGMMLALQRAERPMAGSRSRRLLALRPHFGLAHAAGFLSEREYRSGLTALENLARETEVSALEYRHRVGYLTRTLDWAVSTIRSALVPALDRYARIEPRAAGIVDATVRGSILLPLSAELGAISQDADTVLGAAHTLLGTEPGPGVRGLNPGVALGTLRRLEGLHDEAVDPAGVYLVPETTPELRPVAGVLTLDAGNLLSHVQLLARNLSIPNASVPSQALPLLEPALGRPVFYAVSPLGRVIVRDTARMAAEERRLLETRTETRTERHRLDTSRLRLDVTEPIPLSRLRAGDSGVLAGPKAANLGQLASHFPDRVSPGLALPFGMFVRHVDRRTAEGNHPLRDLESAYREAAAMRESGRSEAEVDAFMFGALQAFRTAIVELEWLPDMRAQVVAAIEEVFSGDLSSGIFVRSDTNVEDLPQFSGAGLNLTIPNQRTVEDLLASVKRVWTSPFTERAYLWRRQVLIDQGQVYPSVLLLRSVPSERSGVMITSGLQNGGPEDLTIATAEGVGGAVDGGEAEMIVVRPGGEVVLLGQARAATRRVLSADGGARMVPSRRPEVLLQRGEVDQLRDIVETWERVTEDRTPGRVWDFEFGVVDGHVWLFQVRPFVRFRSNELLDRLAILDRDAERNAGRMVPMNEELR